MQRYRESWIYRLSFVLISMLVSFHGNNVLAQSSPASDDHLFLIPSDDLIDDDIEIIEEMISQQGEVKEPEEIEVEEPEEIETKRPTTENNDNEDSNSIAAVDNDNEIENDRGIDGYNSLSDIDKDIVTTKKTNP
jgi:hypothetical protein